jgi:alpha-galactosidase
MSFRLLLALLFFGLVFRAVAAGDARQIKIATAHSALTLLIGGDGRVYQLGYGGAGKTDLLHGHPPARESEFYPQYGDGFVLEPALKATHADGNVSTDLIYVRHKTQIVDTNITLTRIELKDPAYPFFVTLCLKTYANEDIIEQWTEIQHQEKSAVTLERFASAAPLLHAKEYWLTQFQGDYRREATLVEEKLTPGTKVLDSKIGTRASRYRIASFILSLNGPAQEDAGEVFGGSLEWPGSFQMAFDVDWDNRLRALCGINPFGEAYRLKPGEVFTTPAMLWTWSNQGKGQVSRNFHRWARSYGIRDGDTPRPVLLNNWEATEFNFNEKIIVSLFDGAKELGADLFLLDDGWFGNRHARTNDTAGLGDWQVNTNRLPQGLSYLAAEANQRGIRFGIWLEPEMVDPVSDLYEQHSEWAIGQPYRQPDLFRNQLGLDLSRPAVRDFVWQAIDDTLKPNPGITYLKWDANRYVTQPGSTFLPPGEQSQLMIDYNFALLNIMARLAKNYPQVTAMLCSGGGGRVDYGALKYFHTFWPSDNTDPRDRVFIQWGFSHFFPAITMAAHVTKMGGRPLKFALDVAMSGALGMDLDVGKLSAGERATVAAGIALYKNELRDVTLRGDLYRLESPYEHPRAALDFVSPDRARAVLFVYQLKSAGEEPVKPRGLDPQRRYRIREVNLPGGAKSRMTADGQVLDGATLMRDGLVPPCHNEFDSSVIELISENK